MSRGQSDDRLFAELRNQYLAAGLGRSRAEKLALNDLVHRRGVPIAGAAGGPVLDLNGPIFQAQQQQTAQQYLQQRQNAALDAARRQQERVRELQEQQQAEDAQDAAEAEDELGAAEDIYEQYTPAKVTEGLPHPDPIVETASLASVAPPDITYQHHLQDNVAGGSLSNAQLETVLYAFQRFQQQLPDGARAGFFMGDGAGVGKGRQIAAIIKEYWATGGRKVLWVSTSNDLRYDARRDLEDLGSDIPVHPPKKDNVPTGPLSRAYPDGGVLFVTYSLLVSKGSYKPPPGARGGRGARGGAGAGRGRGRGRGRGAWAVLDTATEDGNTAAEAAVEAKRDEVRRLFGSGSRLHQLVQWLGGADGRGDCLIILDECHKAKNLLDAAGNSSQTGLAVEALQDQLPMARLLYSSATGASEPDNLRYMVRLGTFGYPSIGNMIDILKASGLGALEMFCMGLKATGTYVSRTLSYKGAEFRMEMLQIDPIFRVMYDRSCLMWSLVYNVLRALPRAKNRQGRDIKGGLFWSAHQRFYRQMLMASKVKRCAELADQALREGMCVVIGLQSTGEANLASAREQGIGRARSSGGGGAEGGAGEASDEMDDFVSAPKMVLQNFISQWLFHFTELSEEMMSRRAMRRLQLKVYNACKDWGKLPSAADEADLNMRAAKLAAAKAARAEAAAAAAAAAASAGAAGTSRGAAAAAAVQTTASPYGRAVAPGGGAAAGGAYAAAAAPKPPAYDIDDSDSDVEITAVIEASPGGGGAAAAPVKPEPRSGVFGAAVKREPLASAPPAGPGRATANGGGAGPSSAGAGPSAARAGGSAVVLADDDDEIVMEAEKTADEIYKEKVNRALLAGELIDLAEDDEARLEADLRAMDAEEAAEERRRVQAARDEKAARLAAAVADAKEQLEFQRREVAKLEGGTNPTSAAAATDGAAAAVGGGAYGTAPPPATANGASQRPQGSGSRGASGSRAASGSSAAAGAAAEAGQPEVASPRRGRRRAVAKGAAAGLPPKGPSAPKPAAAGGSPAGSDVVMVDVGVAGAGSKRKASWGGEWWRAPELAADDEAALEDALEDDSPRAGGSAAAGAAADAPAADAPAAKRTRGAGGRRRAVVDSDDEDGEGAGGSKGSRGSKGAAKGAAARGKAAAKAAPEEEEVLEDDAAEASDSVDSDEDDFVSPVKTRGRKPAAAPARGRVTRGATAAAAGGAATAAGGGGSGSGVNILRLRAAKVRLTEAEKALDKAQKELDEFFRGPSAAGAGAASGSVRANGRPARAAAARANAAAASSGGAGTGAGAGGAARGGRGGAAAAVEEESSEEGSSSNESSEESSEVDDDDDFSPNKERRAQAREPNPAAYRHAVKNKPLKNVPESWGRGGGGGRGAREESEDLSEASSSDDEESSEAEEEPPAGAARGTRNTRGTNSGAAGPSNTTGTGTGTGTGAYGRRASLEDEEDEGEEGEEEVELIDEGPGAGALRGSGPARQRQGVALPEELRKCRTMLLRLLDAMELPVNPLDQLTELLGGEGAVAEMTGRKLQLVRNDAGKVVCKQRREDEAQKMVNMVEKEDFMAGRKRVAIISDAASTGISLQADRRVANQARRFHITLELPWSADKAIQQFGRSHRSNQASAPIYCLLVTKCGGEYRFAGAVAKRLTSLGALLRGDRRALGASSDLKPFDVDNKYGTQAINRLLECVCAGVHTVAGASPPDLPPELRPPATPEHLVPGSGQAQAAFMAAARGFLKTMGLVERSGSGYGGEFWQVVGAGSAAGRGRSADVPRFLNRLLGLPLQAQDVMFSYFFNIMESLIKQARTAGTYEEGILNLASSRVAVQEETVIHTDPHSGAATSYLEVDVDDGLSWDDAEQALEAALADMRAENAPPQAMAKVGFYIQKRQANVGGTGHPLVLLATAMRKTVLSSSRRLEYRIQRPQQLKGYVFTEFELEDKYVKVDKEVGKKHWTFWHEYLREGCLHGRQCARRQRLGACNFGSRVYRLYIVAGAVLPLLRQLFDTVMGSNAGRSGREGGKPMPRVARIALGDGRVVVGLSLLPQDADNFVARVQQ
ncbi:hypothetical protein HYH03_005339 [Edaphochlamys debaryana]|uniref:Strawberry notch n=1 Tax=Edaphochlamys debaryana TaxID=47281 RepID=A0A835Y5H5_9CHLO|nr:hypothetical protein HYH03_005339 [Edaphochlamys debaryana]|eukprot:KAG2496515.1 hypothetical protein HYH03_005339 [Edaphochlamys debaryana]